MTTVLDGLLSKAERLVKRHVKGRVMGVLVRIRKPLTAAELSSLTEIPPTAMRGILADLQREEKIAAVHIEVLGGPAYRPVEIGICEWCGLLDHHLVGGECAACAAATRNQFRPSDARRVC